MRSLENVIIDSLNEFSIDCFTKEDDTGVWTPLGKIASIGIKVSKWTTYHGFSLNIFDNLEGFNLINPCGNESEQMSSVHQFNDHISFEDVAEEGETTTSTLEEMARIVLKNREENPKNNGPLIVFIKTLFLKFSGSSKVSISSYIISSNFD